MEYITQFDNGSGGSSKLLELARCSAVTNIACIGEPSSLLFELIYFRHAVMIS